MKTTCKHKRKPNLSGYKQPKRDAFQRLNFLYQAAHCAMSMNPPETDLARYYARMMKTLSLKNLLRLSPHIKRNICKSCCNLLLPGVTCTIRNSNKKTLIVKCCDCKYTRRFPLQDVDYQLWQDKQENISKVVSFEQL